MDNSLINQFIKTDTVFTSNTFGLLRKTIIENLGKEKAKRFLLRFGFELGQESTKKLFSSTTISTNPSKQILDLHIALGHVSKVTTLGHEVITGNGLTFKDAHGIWHDSFEVKQQVDFLDSSTECSCYILSGFASGSMSTIFNEDIFVKELTCRSKGDLECTFEVNTRIHWESTGEKLDIYNNEKIQDELNFTYDKLLEQKNLLRKVTNFHSKITENIAQQNDLNTLLKTSFNILNIPVFITNTQGTILFQQGIELSKNFVNENFKISLASIDSTYKTANIINTLLITPILLDNKTFAYCYFLYDGSISIDKNDYLFLERLSVAASLCFLNEKVGFEASERLKINFLDRLIYNQFQSISEINIQANYIEPKIFKPYRTLSLKITEKSQKSYSNDNYQTLLDLASSLKIHNLPALLSQKGDHIVIFLYNLKNDSEQLTTLKKVIKKYEKINSSIKIQSGVSNLFDDFLDFNTSLLEAEQAMNSPKKETLIFYNDLGFFSALLENFDENTLIQLAKKEFKSLLEPDEKNRELLLTLYVYLKNNRKLEQTMVDLSLSIGGIKYRINKIEKILQKNLKDATTIAHLLLLIETLILLDFITFD